MSLHKAKTLYCVSVMALALILAARAGGIGEVTAVILLAGALPAWALIGKLWKAATLTALEQRRHERASLPMPREEKSAPLDLADTHRANHQ